MFKKTSLLLVLTLVWLRGFAQQDIPQATPSEVGLSSEHLGTIDTYMNKAMAEGWMPGGVFLVARKGKIAYLKTFGKRDAKNDYKNDDIFRWASMTKPVTTVAVMQLWERGMFMLDDPIHMYLPEFKDTKVLDTFNERDSTYTTVEAQSPITIRHLLTHTSGIYYGDFSPGKLAAIYTKADLMELGLSHERYTNKEQALRLAKQPLAFQPGTQWNYGLNMDVLGYLVETLSGMTLEEYFTKNIFEPLGMKDAYFYLPKEKSNRLVPVYAEINGKLDFSPEKRFNYPNWEKRIHYAGGGGLSGTAMDYAKLSLALMNGGTLNGKRVLGRKTIELMISPQMQKIYRANNQADEGSMQALGFNVVTDGGPKKGPRTPGTFSWGGFFNTNFFIDPKEELVFVGMTQISPTLHWEFWEKLDALVYSAVE